MSGDISGGGVVIDDARPSARIRPVEELRAVDVGSLDDHDLLEFVADCERTTSHLASLQLAAVAEFARRPARIDVVGEDRAAITAGYARPGVRVREFADSELAARLCVSEATAGARVALACALVGLPRTRAALAAGELDVARARVVADVVSDLDPDTAREVEAAVADRAPSLPPRRLRERLSRAARAADPLVTRLRARRARSERHVWFSPLPDGMAEVGARLPAEIAASVREALAAAVRAQRAGRASGDTRTADQLRADAFAAPFVRALETGVLDGAEPVRLARHR